MVRPLLTVGHMRVVFAVTALVAFAAPAAADSYDATQPATPNDVYVIGAGSVGVQRAVQAGVDLEAGKRLDGTPLFARGQLTTGTNGGDGGAYQQLRVGVEGRGCAVRELFCAFGGLDAGYQHDHVNTMTWSFGITSSDDSSARYVVDAHDLVVVPRAGVEAGRHIKVRAAIELPFYRRLDRAMDSDTSAGGMGVGLSLGVGYAF